MPTAALLLSDPEQRSFVTPAEGLTAEQVRSRRADGLGNAVQQRTSRTTTEILRANIFTLFNGLLVALFGVVIATGQWRNGLFGGVVVANAAIGITQEVRAKRTLDQLALLNVAKVQVRRDGASEAVDSADLVLDDLVELRPGDQVPADGVVRFCVGLEVDESLLTGEADPVIKAPEEAVQSGSIVVAGNATIQLLAVGAQAYAARLAVEARRFALTRSELVEGTNRLLRWISVMLVVVGPLVMWSQLHSTDNRSWQDAAIGTVAALVGMIPEGLVLLTSLAFMVATVTLARGKTLVQELPAVEGLARVDVVCFDKTGTLTEGDIAFERLELLYDESELASTSEVHSVLAFFGTGANATARVLAHEFPIEPAAGMTTSVPFSSARKWAAATGPNGTWAFGAPEMLLPLPTTSRDRQARQKADDIAAEGFRVLLLAQSSAECDGDDKGELPADLQPIALVVLAERLRSGVAETLDFFRQQGVALKVISGDNPRTVSAIATRAGLLDNLNDAAAIDARDLPEDLDELAAIVEEHSAFGRVSPHQKRAMVAALQRRGHVVAMTGDGVNDALALKDADIGVAMGSGSAATRAVAQIVLLDGNFQHLPEVVAEGRRVAANIERAATLFVLKNVYALVLALMSVAAVVAYPLAPIQLTLIATATIGIPGFVLALAPNQRRYVPGYLGRVLRFALPAGILVGASAYLAYWLDRLFETQASVAHGRSAATIVVLTVSLWVVFVLARPLRRRDWSLLIVIVTLVTIILAVPMFGHAFLFTATPAVFGIGLVIGACGIFAVETLARSTWRFVRPD